MISSAAPERFLERIGVPDAEQASLAERAALLLKVLRKHRLLSVMDILDQRGVLAALTPASRALISQYSGADQGMELQSRMDSELCSALSARGLDFLVLKGAALGATVYGGLSKRFRYDLDLLVDQQDVDRCVELLVSLGYRRLPAPGNPMACQQGWGLLCGEFDHHVDLHWDLCNHPAFQGLLDYPTLYRASIPLPALAPGARGLSVCHALLHACIHRYGHHRLEFQPLQWLLDVDLLWRAAEDEQRAATASQAVARGMAALMADMLADARAVFSTPIEESYLEQLRAAGAHEWRRRFADTSRSEGAEFWLLLRSAPTWRRRVSYVRFRLFPPAHWVQRQPRENTGVLAYGKRWLRIFRRLLSGRGAK